MNYTNLNQNLTIYFREIRNNKSLTKEDETVLFARIAAGSEAAKTEVFNKMAKLAVAIAKTYTSKTELLEDLIQEANVGTWTAIDKFDPSKGYRFSSYARWWMKSTISRFLDELGLVHPSNPSLIDKARRIREEFYTKNQREITEYELMDALEEMGEVVTDLSAIIAVTHIHIDRPVDSDQEVTAAEVGEFAARTSSVNDFEEESEAESLNDEIERRMRRLTPRERILVKMRFGYTTGYEMDFKSIAEEWNKTREESERLTQERVRQLVQGAIKKMK
jgi:RNA polymerase sigma factor (sigma-70 family)